MLTISHYNFLNFWDLNRKELLLLLEPVIIIIINIFLWIPLFTISNLLITYDLEWGKILFQLCRFFTVLYIYIYIYIYIFIYIY